jgi:hypothetical protein
VFRPDHCWRRGGNLSGGRAGVGQFAACPFRCNADAHHGTSIDQAADDDLEHRDHDGERRQGERHQDEYTDAESDRGEDLRQATAQLQDHGAPAEEHIARSASSGFKNQGQFIAALHVSKNVGIPFKDLKNDMTRKNMSLGQSIQDLKKSAASTTEAKKGETEANEDLKSSASRRSIARMITSNTPLSSKVQALLPSGTTVTQAAQGFSSESQFLAALHASKDLAIPFSQIKTEMTGRDHDTLTRAIQELKPTANATTAAKTAQTEAAADIKSTNPSTPTNHDGDEV